MNQEFLLIQSKKKLGDIISGIPFLVMGLVIVFLPFISIIKWKPEPPDPNFFVVFGSFFTLIGFCISFVKTYAKVTNSSITKGFWMMFPISGTTKSILPGATVTLSTVLTKGSRGRSL